MNLKKIIVYGFIALTATAAAPSYMAAPLRIGFIPFNRELDRQKALAAADFGGWVPVAGNKVIGSINDKWVGFVDLGTLEFQWWFKSDSSLAVPAGVFGDGFAYLGFSSGTIAKVSLADGKPTWQVQLSAFPTRSFIKVNDLLIAQATNGNVYAIHTETGKTQWVTDVGAVAEMSLRVGAAPVVMGNQIVLANTDGVLLALDVETGRIDWREFPQAKRSRFVGYMGHFFVNNGRFIGSRYDGVITAMRPNQDQVHWQKVIGKEILTSASFDNQLFVGTPEALLLIDVNSGAILKTVKTHHPVAFIVKSSDRYILASEFGDISSYDLEFNLMWSDYLSANLKTAPFVIGKNLYVNSGLKNIYVYRVY